MPAGYRSKVPEPDHSFGQAQEVVDEVAAGATQLASSMEAIIRMAADRLASRVGRFFFLSIEIILIYDKSKVCIGG